mmetsp:Transcript_48060/g.102991  ORF Transcript_48060/g.102991 Transcript_48060/m.102991 type:complete len:262 (-) Transcript_48060:383-1168(-)
MQGWSGPIVRIIVLASGPEQLFPRGTSEFSLRFALRGLVRHLRQGLVLANHVVDPVPDVPFVLGAPGVGRDELGVRAPHLVRDVAVVNLLPICFLHLVHCFRHGVVTAGEVGLVSFKVPRLDEPLRLFLLGPEDARRCDWSAAGSVLVGIRVLFVTVPWTKDQSLAGIVVLVALVPHMELDHVLPRLIEVFRKSVGLYDHHVSPLGHRKNLHQQAGSRPHERHFVVQGLLVEVETHLVLLAILSPDWNRQRGIGHVLGTHH